MVSLKIKGLEGIWVVFCMSKHIPLPGQERVKRQIQYFFQGIRFFFQLISSFFKESGGFAFPRERWKLGTCIGSTPTQDASHHQNDITFFIRNLYPSSHSGSYGSMGPSNSFRFLSFEVVCHFHNYGRKAINLHLPLGILGWG